MARPAFAVHYLIFCTSVEYADPNRPHRNSILNGVDYTFKVPPNTEFPVEPDEFWLFARLYSHANRPITTHPLSVTCTWLDGPGGQPAEVWRRDLGAVQFLRPHEVIDRAWAFRNLGGEARYPFPGIGRYEFRLWHPIRKWPGQRVKAQEHVYVEAQP